MKIANTRIMKPIKVNRLSSIVLILLDILAESDKRSLVLYFSFSGRLILYKKYMHHII